MVKINYLLCTSKTCDNKTSSNWGRQKINKFKCWKNWWWTWKTKTHEICKCKNLMAGVQKRLINYFSSSFHRWKWKFTSSFFFPPTKYYEGKFFITRNNSRRYTVYALVKVFFNGQIYFSFDYTWDCTKILTNFNTDFFTFFL